MHSAGSGGVEPLERRRLLSAATPGQASALGLFPEGWVENVYVAGAAWATPFKQYLRDHYTASSADYGWAIYGGGTPHRQFDVLPWVNLDQVSVRFSTAVRAAPDDLRVRGVNVPSYEAVSVRVDPTNGGSGSVATWTLARPVAVDRLVIEIEGDEGGVTNEFNSLLDLDEDGVPGGDFSRRLNVLSRDVDGNGFVTATDALHFRHVIGAAINSDVEPVRYSVWDDLDGSGRIDIRDLLAVRSRVFTYLPRDGPATVASTPSASAVRTRPSTRGLFSAVSIIA